MSEVWAYLSSDAFLSVARTFLTSSAFLLLIFGGIGYIFQQPITSWLTKRVSARLEKQTEDYKHELARSMERYKDELNRLQNVDRVKMDVRKAVVEKLLEQRLAALHEISVAIRETPSWVIAAMANNGAKRRNYVAISEKIDAFYAPINRYSLYFPDSFHLQYRELGFALTTMGNDWTNGTIIPMDDSRSTEILQMTANIGMLIAQMHLALPDELANIIAGGIAKTERPIA